MAGMADDAEQTLEEEAPKTIPFEQYQKLQRRLSAEQARQKEVALSRLDLDDIKDEVTGLAEAVGLLLKTSGRGAYDEDPELEEYTSKRQYQQAGRAARREISQMLLDSEADWSDPHLAPVREAYEAGRFEDAVKTAKQTLIEAKSEKDIEDIVKARLSDALRERGLPVDDGSSAGNTSRLPNDAAELRQRLKDPAWFKEHKAEVMQAVKQGRLR